MAEVLVVEDDEELALLIVTFLERDGHSVRVAKDGEKGMLSLCEGLPDLVLTDVEMPLLDGPGMSARMLIEDVGRECIPLVMVSGVEGLRQVAEDVGTPYYLAKPFAPSALLSLVARALQERRCPRPLSVSHAAAR